MSERMVLMFAYHFPPENAIGGARPYQFYKYLSRMGYRCFVFTAADQGAKEDEHIKYVPDPFTQRPREGISWQLERAIRRFLTPGATGLRWSLAACRTAREWVPPRPASEITIFSTFPPLGAHLAGFRLAATTNLKWIADFRDPFSNDLSAAELTRLQQLTSRRLTRTFLTRADAVIANTDTMAEKWKNSYPGVSDRIHVIWNGFDPEDGIEPYPVTKRNCKVVSHVGELYSGRTVAPILESISRLIDAKRVKAERVRVRLVGPTESRCIPDTAFLERARKQGWLEIVREQVPQLEARRVAQTSDALLLVQPHSTVQVPGKLFEYLRMGRPILAYILPGTPTERILQRSGAAYTCVYAGSSVQDMDRAIEGFLDDEQNVTAANEWFRETFDARRQAEALDALIRSIHRPESGTQENC